MTKRSITYEEGFLAVQMRLHPGLLLEDIANSFWVHCSTISRSFATWIRILIVEMRSIFQQLLHTNVKFSKTSISVDHDAFSSTFRRCESYSAVHLLPQLLCYEPNSPDPEGFQYDLTQSAAISGTIAISYWPVNLLTSGTVVQLVQLQCWQI